MKEPDYDRASIEYSELELSSQHGNCDGCNPSSILSDTDGGVLPPSESNKTTHTQSLCTICLAWITLFLAIMSGAAIGPMFKYMTREHVKVSLAASWRCQCMVLFLLPLAIIEMKRSSSNRVDWFAIKPGLPYPVYVHIIFAGIAWAGNLLCWIFGLMYISTVMASLLACTHPLMLLIYLRLTGKKVTCVEWSGVALAFVGILIASSDSLTGAVHNKNENNSNGHIIGYILCLLAAAFEVAVIINRQVTKLHVPLMQYSASTTIVVCIISSIVSMIVERSTLFEPIVCDSCIFGWLSEKWRAIVLLFGLVIGVVCIAGFNYAVQYIHPVVFASAQLLDPVVTGFISWVAGLEGIPTLHTWISGIVVMSGVSVLVYEEHRKEQEAHLNDQQNQVESKKEFVVEIILEE